MCEKRETIKKKKKETHGVITVYLNALGFSKRERSKDYFMFKYFSVDCENKWRNSVSF